VLTTVHSFSTQYNTEKLYKFTYLLTYSLARFLRAGRRHFWSGTAPSSPTSWLAGSSDQDSTLPVYASTHHAELTSYICFNLY